MRRAALPGRWAAVRLLALACAGPAVCAAAGAATPTALVVYAEDAADPFSKADGSGYANDLVRAAFAAVGVAVSFKPVPYARCKQLVLSGSAPVCISMSWDPGFEGRVKFSDQPLILVTPVYFEKVDRPLKARSEAQLGPGLTIGMVRGYEYPESTLRVRERGAVFEASRDERASLRKLAAGRLDAAIVMSNELTGSSHWVSEAGVQGLVRLAFASSMRELGYLGASTTHAQGLAALEQFNRGYKIINGDGTAQRLKQAWTASLK